MDPNEALAEIRKGLAAYRATPADEDVCVDTYASIIEGIEALDEWLSKGAFLPDAWQR